MHPHGLYSRYTTHTYAVMPCPTPPTPAATHTPLSWLLMKIWSCPSRYILEVNGTSSGLCPEQAAEDNRQIRDLTLARMNAELCCTSPLRGDASER